MELLVPEGYNMFDIAEAVAKLGMMKAGTFLAAARNPALIRDLDSKASRSRDISSLINTAFTGIPPPSRSAAR